MGYLDDIFTTLKATSKSVTRMKNDATDVLDKARNKSIARGALDGTLQFPCLVPDSISISTSSVLARMLERTYASFVQTYLSLNNTIDISVDKNPKEYLKRFHHNIKLESTAVDLYKEHCIESDEEYDAMMERIYDGTTKAYINEKENCLILFNISEKLSREVLESNKELLEEHLQHIDFVPFPNIGNSPFYEAIGSGDMDTFLKTRSVDAAYDALSNTQKAALDKDKEKYKIQQTGGSIPSILKDSDVKKQNDMQPYLMQVRLMAINNEQEFVQFMDFIVGIKVVLHNIKSDEMIINIQNALQNNGKLFNFIRWTTGEKSLIKDLLLHVNDVKFDVANKSKGSSPWWMTLKRMKDTSRAQAAFLSRTQMVPNSTIVLGSYEVDIIKNNTGMDLRDPRFAKKIMDSLFLMNFIIIDEGRRTVDVLYDGETSYQTYALETLEREVSMNSNSLSKELTRMISR